MIFLNPKIAIKKAITTGLCVTFLPFTIDIVNFNKEDLKHFDIYKDESDRQLYNHAEKIFEINHRCYGSQVRHALCECVCKERTVGYKGISKMCNHILI